MSSFSVSLEVKAELVDAAESVLSDAGALGLEVRDAETLPMPGQKAPKKDHAILIAYFETEKDAGAAAKLVAAQGFARKAAIKKVAKRDWSEEWKKRIQPVTVGRIWVGPPWARDDAPQLPVHLVIEPKMAFGTGDHPTTKLCLLAIDEFMRAHPRSSVLDVGTGTGVLAFAAKQLSAARVVATDNDPMAIEMARENARVNRIFDVALSTTPLDQVKGKFDLVVANILANTLIELSRALALRVKNRLVLAGILLPQAAEVEAAFVALGLVPCGAAVDGEWIRLDFERR